MRNFKSFFSKNFLLIFYCFFGLSTLTFSSLKPISDVMLDADLKASIALIEQKGFMLLGFPDPNQTNTSSIGSWIEMNKLLGIPAPHPSKNVSTGFQYKIAIGTDSDGKTIMLKINKDGIPYGTGGGLFEVKINNQLFLQEGGGFLFVGTYDIDLGLDGSYVYTKLNPENTVFGPGDDNLKKEIFFKGGHGDKFQGVSIGHSARSVCALDRNTVIIVSSSPGVLGFHICEDADGFSANIAANGWSAPFRNILADKGKFKSVSLSSDKIIFAVKDNGQIAAYGLDGTVKSTPMIPNIDEVNNNTFKKICFKGSTTQEYSMVALTEDGRIFTASSKRPNKNLTDDGLSNIWDASISKDGLLLISMVAQDSSNDQKMYGGRTYIGKISFAPSAPETAMLARNSDLIDGLRVIRNSLESSPDYIRILDCSAKVDIIDYRSYPEPSIFRDFYGVPKGKENGKVMVLRAMAGDGNIAELIASPENKGMSIGGSDVGGTDPNFNSYEIDCGNDGSYAWLRVNTGAAFLRNSGSAGNVFEILSQYNPIKLRRISISDENTVIGVGFDDFVYRLTDRDAKLWQKVDKAGQVRDASVVKEKTSGATTLFLVDSNGDVKKMNGFDGNPEAVTLDYSLKDDAFERGFKFNTISASTLSGGNGLYFAARNDGHRIFEERNGKLVGPLPAKEGEPICFTNGVKTGEYRTLIFNIWADPGKASEFADGNITPTEIINRINDETTWKSGATFIKGPEQQNTIKDEIIKESIKKIEENGFVLLGSPNTNPNQINTNPELAWIEMNQLLGIPTPDPAKNITAHFQYRIAVGNNSDGSLLMLKINKDGIPFSGGGGLFEGTLSKATLSIEELKVYVKDVIDMDLSSSDGSIVYSKVNPNFNVGSDGYKKELFFKPFGPGESVSIGGNAISLSLADKNNYICISTNPGADEGFWLLENTNGFSAKNEAGAYTGPARHIFRENGKFKWVSLSTDKIIFAIKADNKKTDDNKIVVYDLAGTVLKQQKIPNIDTINGQNSFKKIMIKGSTTENYTLMALTDNGKVFVADSNNKNLRDIGFSNIFDASVSKDGHLMFNMLMQKTSGQQRTFGGRTYIGNITSKQDKLAKEAGDLAAKQAYEEAEAAKQAADLAAKQAAATPTNPLAGSDATAMSTKIAELKASRFDAKTEHEQATFFNDIFSNIENIKTVLGENNENWKVLYEQYQYLRAVYPDIGTDTFR